MIEVVVSASSGALLSTGVGMAVSVVVMVSEVGGTGRASLRGRGGAGGDDDVGGERGGGEALLTAATGCSG